LVAGQYGASMAPVQRTLTWRELNRAVLARQLLLERSAIALDQALQRMGGLQAQYAPSMYLGLWSRVAGLEREDVTDALRRRRIVQGTLLRSTIHLVSAQDYWPFAVGVRAARRAWFLRAVKGTTAAELETAAARLREALADGPLRRSEIDRIIEPRLRIGVGLWLDMVRVPPSGTWERRRADLYSLAEDWVGPCAVSEDDALDLLVRRYLGGFGPATRAELADWAGVGITAIAPAIQRLAVRRFRAEDGAELLDLRGAPLPPADTVAPVRFLPVWDATLLVHARRARILPEEYRSKVFNTKTPHSVNTFLVDGTVAGTWRYDKGRIHLDEFAPLPASVRRTLAEEADRLATFYT
jgi:winged helix DNA-binding protein